MPSVPIQAVLGVVQLREQVSCALVAGGLAVNPCHQPRYVLHHVKHFVARLTLVRVGGVVLRVGTRCTLHREVLQRFSSVCASAFLVGAAHVAAVDAGALFGVKRQSTLRALQGAGA
jgi:hypothetical protein